MARRRVPGLVQRGGIWHIDKVIFGKRICRSTGEKKMKDAEAFLAKVIEERRNASFYGVRIERNWRQAAERYIKENMHKSSIRNDRRQIKFLDRYIGKLDISKIHMGVLQDFIKDRQAEGVKNSTINHGLQVVRRVLNLAASEWIDENGLTWLQNAPKIKFLPENNKRKPYPLSWEEQDLFFKELPNHLRDMALFKVNTGTREQEVCNLKWEWEVKIKELDTSIFIIPEEFVKNRNERIVVLNDVAKSIIESKRHDNDTYVFTYNGYKISSMNNTAWNNARKRTGLTQLRVHDLKHTYGRRLRAAGVSFEDRQDLLGHKSAKITSHYSAAEVGNLIECSNKVLETNSRKSPSISILRANS